MHLTYLQVEIFYNQDRAVVLSVDAASSGNKKPHTDLRLLYLRVELF